MKSKFITFLFVFGLLILEACATSQKEASTTPTGPPATNNNIPSADIKDCICVQLWMPVCGDNGKTYSNACFAKCANVKYQQGSCSKVIKE